MVENFKCIKDVNKIPEGSIFNIKQKQRTQGHNLQLTRGEFKSNVTK